MKKVALITCYFQPNYGSMLQAYATQYILDKWGIDNETICIDGLKNEIHQKKMQYFKSRMFSRDVLADKYGYAILKIASILDIDGLKAKRKLRETKFAEFSSSYFRTSATFKSTNELGSRARNYSAFLVGSDQLWLPSNIAADYYTLSYVPKDVLKISYATSFGVSQLPKKQRKQMEFFIPRFDYLSVREETGKKMIQDYCKREAEVVCDPTLLMDVNDWLSLEKCIKEKQGDYVLCYFLGNNEFARECALKLKKITGKKLIGITQLDQFVKMDTAIYDETPFDVDPADFISLIKNAAYVCTDSFHCTVFSIIYRRSFFTFRRFTKNTSMSTNSRIDTLVDVAGLRDRLIENISGFETALKSEIKYDTVTERIKVFRGRSEYFLKESLGKRA